MGALKSVWLKHYPAYQITIISLIIQRNLATKIWAKQESSLTTVQLKRDQPVNKSLQTGTFPQLWKKALVKPLINLKFFSKLIECAALQQIIHHCEKHNLLPQNQSAYQKGYSCETMLIKLADNILNGMENKCILAVIACDLSTAFDTINFEVLLSTFKNYYRISGLVLDRIKSYLTDHSCSVIINNKESDPKSLTLSVPQGSCSGVYFFIMYASTLFEVVQDV